MSRLAGIIGNPARHSLSPVFQAAAFAELGLDAAYEIWETPLQDLPSRFDRLRARDCMGANVTIPYKEVACGLVDELDRGAELPGAVNTVVNTGGRLRGFNTDGAGFVRSVRERGGLEPAGRSFLLLGAGGAARGIAFGLVQAEAAVIAVANRTLARAEGLAADLERSGTRARALSLGGLNEAEGFDCIVNCTSIGMEGGGAAGQLPVDPRGAGAGTLIVDIVYVPTVTPFLRRAREAGLPTLGGLPMLIQQGALAFALWTGLAPPLDAMFTAAEGELGRRSRAHDGPGDAR
ncbi:MAG: shikimate dehydrogenase [Dehalococcoidia bacterium]